MTLELKQVAKRSGADMHIYPTDLRLERGSFNVLLGTTLAGKTTLMQLMAGIQKPTGGELWFDGANVTGKPVQKRNVSVVYQQFINYPNFTVYENIASPLRVARMSETEIKTRVGKFAELLRLTPMLGRKPSELSGGQQQRTAIARALVKQAGLVLLDEPLANLDYKLREELRLELPRIFAETGAIFVYATTEPQEALLLGGRTATLHEGRVTQFNDTIRVYNNPADLVTAQTFSDPPMNLFPLVKSGGKFVFGNRSTDVPVDVAALADGQYTVGIRPHQMLLKEPAGKSLMLEARVTTTRSPARKASSICRPAISMVALMHGVHRLTVDEKATLYSWTSRASSVRPAEADSAPARGADHGEDHARPAGSFISSRSEVECRLRAEGAELRMGGRRRLCSARTLRLWQDHAAQHHFRPAGSLARQRPVRRKDVTRLPTEQRNIAQVFQFPVIYDTMTVHDNLAFPLLNRGVPKDRSSAAYG